MNLKELYEDKDGFRKEEISEISGPNDSKEFDRRLKSLKDFHRRHPDQVRILFVYGNNFSDRNGGSYKYFIFRYLFRCRWNSRNLIL